MASLKERLIKEEGLRLFPYQDSQGIWTIGVGHNIEADVEMANDLPNLQANGITKEYALILLNADILKHTKALFAHLPWAAKLNEARRDVLIDMTFNMGIEKVLKFTHTLEAIKNGQFDVAAEEMLKSLWAKEVGHRAEVLSKVMLTGVA